MAGEGTATHLAGSEKSVADRVVRDVIRGLYEGRYQPGKRLFEGHLTKEYGISRGPVREALNKLAATGIIDLTIQRGARVKILTINEALDTLLVAQALVGLAARLAAQNIDAPGAREEMKLAGEKLVWFDASSSSVDFALARSSFYATLANIANNGQLKLALPGVRIHLIRVQFSAFLHEIDSRRHADYRRITEAVLAGHDVLAERAAQAHFTHAIKALRKCR